MLVLSNSPHPVLELQPFSSILKALAIDQWKVNPENAEQTVDLVLLQLRFSTTPSLYAPIVNISERLIVALHFGKLRLQSIREQRSSVFFFSEGYKDKKIRNSNCRPNSLVVCDESGHTKFPFSFVILS